MKEFAISLLKVVLAAITAGIIVLALKTATWFMGFDTSAHNGDFLAIYYAAAFYFLHLLVDHHR